MVVIDSNAPLQAAEQIEGIRENKTFAKQLSEIGDLLQEQHANEFRVRAYHAAAETIAGLHCPVREILERDGIMGLVNLPTIGHSIAGLLESAIQVGRIPLLDRLRGHSNAEHFFATLPGLGPELSHRIYDHLHIETLSELLLAAKDGRLEHVPGIGRKRREAILASLTHRGVAQQPDSVPRSESHVTVDELLHIDGEYRKRVAEGTLTQIHLAGQSSSSAIPVWHTEQAGRHYTAMFSNTARAQQQHATQDWVIVFRDDANAHGRWTIITARFGELSGFRIVLGREQDCVAYYRQHNAYHQPKAGQTRYPELPTQWEEDAGRTGIHG
ncbi:helix-hairpin-helix domain-containing protein [Rhodopirellula sp. P2]|uniref:helix-hairpin-helix domain-containing protein n=1 Tax=Rhodopirellula sp. P2 TaxID=2127060 RepID=UPI00236776C3|nr:helix-hairpin-helix domain-containing protein [Rhodopirellula sp. P2]WDQ14852.1 helix-hairpin-helix domain-containing protein [Rhodopirellula sp. P2]